MSNTEERVEQRQEDLELSLVQRSKRARHELISAGRWIDARGWCPATGGNFSIRLSELPAEAQRHTHVLGVGLAGAAGMFGEGVRCHGSTVRKPPWKICAGFARYRPHRGRFFFS